MQLRRRSSLRFSVGTTLIHYLTGHCPICRGSVLVGETIDPRPERVGEKGPPVKLYCLHCEMLVVPLAFIRSRRSER